MQMETKPKLKEYASSSIAEREGAMPGFLKLAYLTVGGAALAYFFIYLHGTVVNPGSTGVVHALNAATQASASLMNAVAAMIVVFGIIVVLFSFGKSQD